MFISLTFYIIAFFIYVFYCIMTYKFLAKSQIDNIYKDAITKFGLNFTKNHENVKNVSNAISKWSIGNIFTNEVLFIFAFYCGIFLLIFSVYLFGFLAALIIIIWVFIVQTVIGLLFKGKGIQLSAFFLLFISIILSLYKVLN
jgi:hypothetical protein